MKKLCPPRVGAQGLEHELELMLQQMCHTSCSAASMSSPSHDTSRRQNPAFAKPLAALSASRREGVQKVKSHHLTPRDGRATVGEAGQCKVACASAACMWGARECARQGQAHRRSSAGSRSVDRTCATGTKNRDLRGNIELEPGPALHHHLGTPISPANTVEEDCSIPKISPTCGFCKGTSGQVLSGPRA